MRVGRGVREGGMVRWRRRSRRRRPRGWPWVERLVVWARRGGRGLAWWEWGEEAGGGGEMEGGGG